MKKGFTLIELIATIVILSIITMITMPTINKTIENSRQQAALRSAELYISGIGNSISSLASTAAAINNKVYTTADLKKAGVNYNGDMPDDTSEICISNNLITHYMLYIKNYTIIDGTLLKTSDSNYQTYINLSNSLFTLETDLFTSGLTKYSNSGNIVYYAQNGIIKNYYISDGTNVITDGHVGINQGYIKAYGDSAKLLSYIYSQSSMMTSGSHTLTSSPITGVTLSKTSNYTVSDGEIIDYSFHFAGYVNNSGQVKTE
jgi:prepilin-type N-terminal cleavage/methylation domain-containing protein